MDGPKRRAMGRERTWPNHARHPPRQDLAWAISEGLREPDGKARRAAGGAAARLKAVSERRSFSANPGAFWARATLSPGAAGAGLRVVRCPGRAGGGGRGGQLRLISVA